MQCPYKANMPVTLDKVDLPAKPGVYLFRNADERVLYVGKATVLSQRIRSYFSSNPDRAMIPELVRNSDDIECIVTNSPQEALILERQLIRQHRPRYNSMLKDDKSYPFLALTKEEFPRILYTRHPPKKSWKWGPFPNAAAAKQVVQLLRRHFGIRDCKELLPQGCLAMHIGLCAGPCIEAGDYAQRVKNVRRILNGDASELIEELAQEMDERSNAQEYEIAASIRDMIKAVRTVTSQQVILSKVYRECDAIGIGIKGDLAAIVVIHADDGVIKGQESWPLIHRGDEGDSISTFIVEHYTNRRPPKILLTPIPISTTLQEWLNERRGAIVDVRVPMRGDFVTLTNLAKQNAKMQVERLANKASGSLEQRAADEAASLLSMNSLDHIVCFDMAQLLGDSRVGASVCLRNGRPSKKEYRTYTVKGDALDDLRMMREVVERWIKRVDDWPDLLLIDGGETHLAIIAKLLEKHGVRDRMQLASLAKREETIHREGHDDIILDRRGRVLVHARDEAHRFVNKFHRKSRSRNRLSDPLEGVSGLGAKKLQSLIRHFGGRQGIKHASVADLKTVPGIGPSLAQRIFDSLH
ncbi:MAG: excinuclease ABC subunit UvrC [Candidatus Thermoplasmatota archaeon]|nr:excinuclease ABC subunit UvrC [Candidatus Thermoplasmatota archaeon]|tara:strand:- start:1083 stop:2831 length:1749 start_codon:yes stop_codon:yes gene_type:complete